MQGHWCPGGCATLIALGMELCTSCVLALGKYIDENAVIVERYAAEGVAAMERSLANHAAFDAWLASQREAVG